MKKIHILVLFLLLITIAALSADDTIEFSIRWIVNNNQHVVLDVYDANDNDTFHRNEQGYVDAEVTITPLSHSAVNPVCIIHYETNILGYTYILISATPMTDENDPTLQFEYKLHIMYDGGDFSRTIIPGTSVDSNTSKVPFFHSVAGISQHRIDVGAVLTQWKSMPANSDGNPRIYESVVTITWSSE